MVIFLFLVIISFTEAFRNPFLQRSNNCSKLCLPERNDTPLEILFKEKNEKQEKQLRLYYEVSPIDRIMDDVIDGNDLIHIHSSEVITIAVYVFIILMQQNNKKQLYKKRKLKTNTKKSRTLSFSIICLGVLINFTRNIKPVL
jgi:hypothetical protein